MHEKCEHLLINAFIFKEVNESYHITEKKSWGPSRIYHLISIANQVQFHSNRAGLAGRSYRALRIFFLFLYTVDNIENDLDSALKVVLRSKTCISIESWHLSHVHDMGSICI